MPPDSGRTRAAADQHLYRSTLTRPRWREPAVGITSRKYGRALPNAHPAQSSTKRACTGTLAQQWAESFCQSPSPSTNTHTPLTRPLLLHHTKHQSAQHTQRGVLQFKTGSPPRCSIPAPNSAPYRVDDRGGEPVFNMCVNTGPSFGDAGQQLLHSSAWFLPSTHTFSSNMRRVHTSSTAAATPMPAPLLVTAGVHPDKLGSAAAASHTVRGAAPAAAAGALRGRQSCCATHSCIVKHGLHPAHRHVQSTH